MSGVGAPRVTIPLRDGTELVVGPEGVYVGERRFALQSIQDARQVAPDPETVALRVAGSGMIEFQPARPGDGPIALDALYRLRPELRPPGFELTPAVAGPPPGQGTPTPPMGAYGAANYPPYGAPGYPPPAPYGPPAYAPPGYPPAGYAPVPPPYAPPPPAPYGYGYSPNAGRAELTPYPRNFGETLGAIFQLYFKHWGKWLALGLCVALLPAIMGGGIQVLLYLMLGLDPFSAQTSPAITVNSDGTITSPFKIASPDKLILYGWLLAGALVVIALFSAWQTAALAIGGREAVLGRRVRVGRALGGGLRRYGSTLGALLVVNIIKYALLAPGLVCFGLAVASISTSSASGANLQAAQTGSLLSCLALALLIPGAVGATIFDVRLGLAPYAAATERIGSGAALRKSWQLTRGYFWRVLGIILIVAFAVAIVGYAAGLVGVASTAAALLVVVPLVSIVTAPLTALAYTTLLYDLRLRQEGYAGVMAETTPVETPVAP